MNCTHCGAALAPNDTKCQYCGTVTAAGVWTQAREERRDQAREQAQAFEQTREKQRVEAQIKAGASNALLVSIIGLVLCCIPVIPIVGLVLGVRARNLARQHGVLVPGNASAAIAISVLGVLGFGASLTWILIEEQRKEERRGELEKALDGELDGKKLDDDAACKLVELHLLEEGYKDISGTSFDSVSCNGKLRHDGDTASLDDLKIKASSKSVVAIACFKRGNKWFVERLADTSCDEEEEAAATSAAASAAPSASASAAPSASAGD